MGERCNLEILSREDCEDMGNGFQMCFSETVNEKLTIITVVAIH